MDSKFSYEVNMEILSRTSLKSLNTICCTNKELENLRYDSYLLNLHKQRNNMVSGFLIRNHQGWRKYTNEFAPSHGSNSLDLGFLPKDAQILASSEQGIIVFQSPAHPRNPELVSYHVCKPATKQVLRLPNPKTEYYTNNVALVVVGSKPLHYKIVRLSDPTTKRKKGGEAYTSYVCEIFDSRLWGWREDDVILPFCDFVDCIELPITTRGSIYLLLIDDKVLKFDAYSEKWTTFSLPIRSLCSRKLVKYKGKLGLACQTPSRLCWEIWVLTSHESWEKFHVFDDTSALVAIYDSDTRVMQEDSSLVFYSFKGGHYIHKVTPYNITRRIFPFQSDFEPAHLKPSS